MMTGHFDNGRFIFEHRYDEDFTKLINYQLHNHEDPLELICVLKGKPQYTVEGTVYNISPGDILVVRPDEMHGLSDIAPGEYDRISFYVSSGFFEYNHCKEFYDVLCRRPSATDNLIHMDSSAFNIRTRIKYIDRYVKDNRNDSLLEAALTELLYMIINTRAANSGSYKNEHISKVIAYINANLAEELSLDKLSGEFFISKQYLCKIFKKHTGITVNEYITAKRLTRVQERYSEYGNMLSACIEAGYNNYSAFYRAYVKHYGYAPKEGIKKPGN